MFIRIIMMKSLSAKLLLSNSRSISAPARLKLFKPVFFTAFLSLFFILIHLTSCKKDPYTLGLSLLPPTDTLTVKTSDTATIIAYSVIQDSIRSDKTSTNMLGSLYDPVFGLTTASFCTQFLLSSEGTDFGINPVLDSVVLMLKYNSLYGDSNALQRVRVYELDEDISLDSAYYSNHQIKYYNTLLADQTFKPNLKDSISIFGTKVLPHLRINLSKHTNYFGNKILYCPPDALLSNKNFTRFIKGLYIESSPVNSGGALLSFNMNSVLTALVVFFHNQDASGKLVDSLGYSFSINSYCARINTFDHNHYNEASPELKGQVLNNDTSLGKNMLYLQGLAGVKIKIRLPFIQDYGKSKRIALNNATLILKNFETDTILSPPPQLTIVQEDSLGKIYFLIDNSEGVNYLGGTYHASDKSYRFRITRHIQQIILNKSRNNDLYLLVNNPASNVLTPNRVIGTGTDPQPPAISSDRLQLQLIFTKLY
jgi:hypothetical protein